MVLIYVAVAVAVGYMYRGDYLTARSGAKDPKALPGALPCDLGVWLVGAIGALLILSVETGGEMLLGLVTSQSEMVWYFVFVIVAAGIVEEVVFRGFLVVEHKGRAALVGSCVGFSLLFALGHGHFWSTQNGFEWAFTVKAAFSTTILFANSIWFYALRFGPWNPNRSIFPCMLAHALSNLGVFVVKWVQGYVTF
jgi:membrane protease YdiL (CAAX protease family)